MVDQAHVDQALKRLSQKTAAGMGTGEQLGPADMPPLLFEQDSWDAVLKRMGEGGGRF